MFDCIISGNRICTGGALKKKAIGIREGVIAAIMDLPCSHEARERIETGDDLVAPGLVDTHVHFREPGMAYKEGFANGSKAAAAGGVTTVLVQPTDKPVTITPDDLQHKRALAEGQCFVDFGLQVAVSHELEHIPKLAELGASSFEIFMGDQNPTLRIDDGAMLVAALNVVKKTGRITGITPSEYTIVEVTTELKKAGAKSANDFPRARPPHVESLAIARAANAAMATQTEVIFRQTSCRASVNILRSLRHVSGLLHAEVNPHYLYLTDSALDRLGPFAVMSPPLRVSDDVSGLWDGLLDGTIDLISTDHAPHFPEEKECGLADVWDAPMGVPGLQTMLPLLLASAAEGRCT
jgi:dihydroorotase (multifunctional complex type)